MSSTKDEQGTWPQWMEEIEDTVSRPISLDTTAPSAPKPPTPEYDVDLADLLAECSRTNTP